MSKSKMKRILALVLMVCFIVSIATACGGTDTTSNDTTTSTTTSTTVASTAEETQKELEPYEFSFYYNYDWVDLSTLWGVDKVSALLKEKFNITLKGSKPEGDPAQKMNIMIAADDLPDVMMIERDATYNQLIKLDKLVDLNGYIANNSNYAKAIDPTTINLAKINEKSYGMLNWATSNDHPTGNAGWVVNKSIYEKLGSPKLQTTEDLYNYIKLVKDKNLTVDGKPVLPFQSNPDMLYLICNSFGLNYMGGPMVGCIPTNNELKLFYTDPKFTDAMLFLNKLWRENLLNKDCFVEKSEQIDEKLSNGRVAVYAGTDVTSKVPDMRKRLIEKDPTNDYTVIEPIAAPGLEQKDIKNTYFMTLGWNIISITKKAKSPERIFQLFDYLISPEGATLAQYGPKGELYDEVDENGYPILKKTAASLAEAEQKVLGAGYWVMPGNSVFADFSKVADDNRKPVEKRDWTIQAQSNIVWKHSMNLDAFANVIPDPQSPEGIANAAFSDLNNKSIPKIVMAKDEDLCKQYISEATNSAYKLGFDKVEKYVTNKYQENLKRMGK